MMAPVTWLIFAIRHTSSGKPIAWRWVALLMVMPLVTLGVVFTNEAHHLFWSEVALVQAEGQFFLRYTFGPWFGLHMIYSYALILIGSLGSLLAHQKRDIHTHLNAKDIRHYL